MKKMFILAAMAAAMMVAMPAQAQSRKDKKAAEKERWERQQQREREEEEMRHKMRMDSLARVANASYGTEVDIPCIDASFDDEEYFRDLGIGTDINNNQQAARLNAVNQAKSMIKARLGEFIQGVTSDYFNSYAGSKPADDVQHKMESKLNGVVEKMLNDADKECEKRIKNDRGNWEFYYVIRIPKEDLKKNMMTAWDEEKTKIDFNEHQMQQFMDGRMDDMLKAKDKAGY